MLCYWALLACIPELARVCVCARALARVYMCVCEREREREDGMVGEMERARARARATSKQTDRQTDRAGKRSYLRWPLAGRGGRLIRANVHVSLVVGS